MSYDSPKSRRRRLSFPQVSSFRGTRTPKQKRCKGSSKTPEPFHSDATSHGRSKGSLFTDRQGRHVAVPLAHSVADRPYPTRELQGFPNDGDYPHPLGGPGSVRAVGADGAPETDPTELPPVESTREPVRLLLLLLYVLSTGNCLLAHDQTQESVGSKRGLSPHPRPDVGVCEVETTRTLTNVTMETLSVPTRKPSKPRPFSRNHFLFLDRSPTWPLRDGTRLPESTQRVEVRGPESHNVWREWPTGRGLAFPSTER